MEDLSDDVIHGLSDSLTLVGLFGKKQSIIAETTSLNLRYFKLGSGISNISVQSIDVIV
jgi:hypothetical protein